MEGDVIFTPKLEYKNDEEIEFNKVLFYSDKKNVFGSPYLKNVSIKAKVLCHTKDDKVKIFKKKEGRIFKNHRGIDNCTQKY